MIGWAILLLCGWLAAAVSGAAGFGGALLLLPVISHFFGAKAAVPILTLAQLLGNVSRAGFGVCDIRWRPALIFSAGAIPASIIGARLFVELPSALVMQVIGMFLLVVVILRHTSLGKYPIPRKALAPAGMVVGFLSAVVGSAGPLGAAVFLSLHLPQLAYVATEAVTATLMHLTKSVIYGRYALITSTDLLVGVALGGAMILGSWTGRKLIERLSPQWFSRLVESLLVIAALSLIFE
ncbi:MAG TPA: sulfite exporter TauE/SafE family protein [Candidatus Binatia bacterium]|jgi:hypothetical protein|nr:sulfite exporter TauE/SafE family protein [Candidatus Binatia bacterium]